MAIVSAQEFLKGGKIVSAQPSTAPQETGYLADAKADIGAIGSDLATRKQRMDEIAAKGKAGEISDVSGVLQTAGQIAGGLGDIIFRGIKAIAPEPVEQGVKKGVEAVANTKPVQDVVGTYQSWKAQHPEAAANLEATLNIASVIPAVKGGELAGKGIVKGVDTATDIAKGATKQAAKTAGAKLDNVPSSIMQRVARIPKSKQAKFEEMAGESVGDYLVRRNIYGDVDEISTQLYKTFSRSKSTADTELARLKGTYKAPPIKEALQQLYAREKRVSSPGAFSKDYKRVSALAQKYNKEGLNMSEINEVKRLYERNVRLDFVKQNLPESVAKSTNIDNALREWQFSKAKELGLQNLDEINRETRLAKQLLDDIGKEYAGAAGNNAITLTDWIVLSGGDPTAIAGFLAKKGISSKKVQSAIAKNLSPKGKVDVKPKHGKPKAGFREFIRSTEGRTTPQ